MKNKYTRNDVLSFMRYVNDNYPSQGGKDWEEDDTIKYLKSCDCIIDYTPPKKKP